jgi:DEAD/DEAH box helicase domain-containing protein
MSIDTALAALRFDLRFMENIVRWQRIPAQPARTALFPAELDSRLVTALNAEGIDELYTHQAAAISAALRGEHVAIATPAASGKTYCFNLPVLHRLLADPQGRALYLFPTKALAQDQLASISELATRLPAAAFAPGVYDGDTPSARRPKIRDSARILLSNPDMLHVGILPQHPRWAPFFAALRVVVIDEMHVYRGIFGSHVANVLRRLRRICSFYGSRPQFILASATIANPQELAERLVEAPITLVGPEENGAPQGEKHFVFYNPPIIDPELGIRKSHRAEAANLASHFLEHDTQTIVFTRSRLGTELLLAQLKDGRTAHAARQIHGYRGGYLPHERRQIERGLREGEVRTVVATNALELGIDIGRLDAAILAGYPGSIAGTRQQLGRAGRRSKESVGILVAGMAPLDQFVVSHPQWLLTGAPEHARLNPDNPVILAGHLACAAAELPLQEGEPFGSNHHIASVCEELIATGQLYQSGGRCYWAGENSPAPALSLRSAGPDRVVIQMTAPDDRRSTIGEVDVPSVPLLVYPGAVYLHEGSTYMVESLDLTMGIANVRRTEVDFFTVPSIDTQVEMLSDAAGPSGGGTRQDPSGETGSPSYLSGWGDARITRSPTGYKILRRGTNEILGLGDISLPPATMETEACWLSFPEQMIEPLKAEGMWLSDPNEYGANWPAQRGAARKRDGYRCQGCGTPEPPGKQHDVHHKVPFRAFTADATRREGLPATQAWQIANRLANLVTLCPACHRRAEATIRTRSGLSGLAALIIGVAPLFLMCDPGDLGVQVEPQDAVSGRPTITVYEQTPGGVGYAEQVCRSLRAILIAARELVMRCPCQRGCPACVGPVLEHEYSLDTKALALALLTAAL